MTIKDAIEVAGLRSTAGAAELSGHVPPDRRRRGLQAPRRRGDRLREDQRAAAAFPHNQQGQISDRVLDVNGEPAPHPALLGWTGLIGVVGLPFAVASAGRTAAGSPVGVQLVAPFLRDRDAVWAARMVSEVLGGYQPPPSMGRAR